MRLRSSTKIAIAFGLVVAVAVVGMRVYSDYRVGQLHFPEIKPGRVNLVGVSLGPRFKIIVANHAAQLVELQSGAEKGIDAVGSETSLVKRRVPIHELLKSLQGDEETLGRLLMIVNERSEDLLPPERVYWTAADLNKALGGDPTLQAKLEADLNVRLDGTPLPELRIKSIEDGIIIKAPVAVGARIAGRERTLHGTLLLPFKPRLVTRVEEGYREKTNADRTMIEG
ncbi:MAG: hypothetical protein HYR64_00275, partial [Fimbriimonas ginsengisoli]|nr:hypothetical protein [Fimbriimonas ginsengisoli]